MMGPPGAGKGTQSQKILEKYSHWSWVSTGHLLRSHVKLQSPMGCKAQSYISQGQLVPDGLLYDILAEELKKYKNTHVVLDGYPRNIGQTKALSHLNYPLIALFKFVISTQELCRRISHRAQIERRSDDTPEKLKTRLKIYEQEMAQVYDYYQKTCSTKLFEVSAVGDEDAIASDILDILAQLLS